MADDLTAPSESSCEAGALAFLTEGKLKLVNTMVVSDASWCLMAALHVQVEGGGG